MPDGNPNYQHVAALLALDIDIAWDIAEAHRDDAGTLYGQLKMLKECRDVAVSGDPDDIEQTRRRFRATHMIFNLPVSPSKEEGQDAAAQGEPYTPRQR